MHGVYLSRMHCVLRRVLHCTLDPLQYYSVTFVWIFMYMVSVSQIWNKNDKYKSSTVASSYSTELETGVRPYHIISEEPEDIVKSLFNLILPSATLRPGVYFISTSF